MTKEQAIEVLHELDGSLYETQQVALDLAIKALEQPTSDDCVSRTSVIEHLVANLTWYDNDNEESDIRKVITELVNEIPPVTPTQCIATVQFSKEELRDICNERIEIACQHGTCKDCKWWDSENNKIGYCSACKHGHCSGSWDIGIYRKTKADFYCADFEKRGGET